jgi:2-hydroxy-3-oxopropionate reductase
MKAGYIGLGIMGGAMARNMLKAGYEVVVHNRSRAKVDAIAKEGAIPAQSPKEVAEQVDVVFTNLPDTPDVEQVILGKNGILEGAREGLIVVDNSTITPSATRVISKELAKHGIEFLDAPVSGGDVGAQQGTLTIMVGGPKQVFDKVLPLFEAVGTKITYIGESGAGQIAKVCNQIIVAAQMVSMGEALVLAKKCGVDPERVVEAISQGAAQCWTLDNKPPKIFRRDLSPGFKAYMQIKDIDIVMDTGKTYGVPLPSTAIAQQLYRAMIVAGDGELDNSAILTVLEKMADVKVS